MFMLLLFFLKSSFCDSSPIFILNTDCFTSLPFQQVEKKKLHFNFQIVSLISYKQHPGSKVKIIISFLKSCISI